MSVFAIPLLGIRLSCMAHWSVAFTS